MLNRHVIKSLQIASILLGIVIKANSLLRYAHYDKEQQLDDHELNTRTPEREDDFDRHS